MVIKVSVGVGDDADGEVYAGDGLEDFGVGGGVVDVGGIDGAEVTAIEQEEETKGGKLELEVKSVVRETLRTRHTKCRWQSTRNTLPTSKLAAAWPLSGPWWICRVRQRSPRWGGGLPNTSRPPRR